MRFPALLLAILLVSGCGPGLTRTMWGAPLPSTPPDATRASRVGHRVGRVAVVAGKTVATPVTVIADVGGERCEPEYLLEGLVRLVFAVAEVGLRCGCR